MTMSYRDKLDKIAPAQAAGMPEEFAESQHRSPSRIDTRKIGSTFAQLPREGLDGLGLERINPVRVQQMDSVDDPGEMQEIGKALAKQGESQTPRRVAGGELACLFEKGEQINSPRIRIC